MGHTVLPRIVWVAVAIISAALAQPTAVINARAGPIDGAINITWSPPASGTVTSYRS